MNDKPPLPSRVPCPCCGYLTISSIGACEICKLCNWEDDGEAWLRVHEATGGPNGDYSLAEARDNFKRYRVMYAPGRDQRLTGGDSKLEYETKGLLIEAFERLELATGVDAGDIEADILRLEQALTDEVVRGMREYAARQRGDAKHAGQQGFATAGGSPPMAGHLKLLTAARRKWLVAAFLPAVLVLVCAGFLIKYLLSPQHKCTAQCQPYGLEARLVPMVPRVIIFGEKEERKECKCFAPGSAGLQRK